MAERAEVEALVEAARELTDLHYAAFRTDHGSGDGITVLDSDAEYREQFPKWADMAAALKPWKVPTDIQFQVLAALSKKDHYLSRTRGRGGYGGRAGVMRRGSDETVMVSSLDQSNALRNAGWVELDPSQGRTSNWNWTPDYTITDAGRAALR